MNSFAVLRVTKSLTLIPSLINKIQKYIIKNHGRQESNSKPKFLYIITLSEHGGAQAHLKSIIDRASYEFHTSLATSDEGWLTEEVEKNGVAVHLIPDLVQPLAPKQDLRAVLALYRLIKQLKPNLIHLHSSKAGLLGRVAATLAGVPVVFTAHGWAFTEGASPKRRWLAIATEWLAAPLATRIISVSEYDTALARRYHVGRPGQVRTIHNSLPSAPAASARPSTHDAVCQVAMTARFAPPKDQQSLIRAAAQVPNVHLMLIGDGPGLTEAQTLANRLGIQERVAFLGTRSDVPELLQQADAFALISDYEGFPISILEAMRAGLPVIASDVGGVNEAVQPGINGFLIKRGDQDALVEALRSLADDNLLRHKLGRAGRLSIQTKFTMESMLNATWQVYQEALTVGRKRS